jgi:FkbM family methyltransferase
MYTRLKMQLGITEALRKVRISLASFHLFDNWYLLLIKYALSKIGFNVKLKAKIDGCFIEMDPEVFACLVSRFSRGLIKSIRCIESKLFVNDIEVNNINDVIYNPEIWGKINGWRYDASCSCWIKNNIKFRRMHNSIVWVVDLEEYAFLNVSGKIVVDVGAYIGDSSIYFAIKGAKKVIAIEPHPLAFKEMLENIQLNRLENVIIPINAGLASKHGKIRIENVDVESTHGIYHKLGNCESEVSAITLGEIINMYEIKDDAILKMDCEGCEYDIILNDYEHLKTFKELIFESHAYTVGKPVSEVLKILAKDYQCKIVKRGNGNVVVHCVKK